MQYISAAFDDEDDRFENSAPICLLTFNANDPSGGAGLNADVMACASVGVHTLSVLTGAYARDTAEVFDHYALDDEAVSEQARIVLEDVQVQAIKVGFIGTPENISAVAAVAADYAEVPLIAYMPDLSWWQDDKIESYQDAFNELLLPQATVLVGNYSTLARWLLPDWGSDRKPTARDIARAAGTAGAAYTLVTGIPETDQAVSNVLASPTSVLCTHKFVRFQASFVGSGDTLTAALAAFIAIDTELTQSVGDALTYLEQCLGRGFRPGMGHMLPERNFWALADDDDSAIDDDGDALMFDIPHNDTKH